MEPAFGERKCRKAIGTVDSGSGAALYAAGTGDRNPGGLEMFADVFIRSGVVVVSANLKFSGVRGTELGSPVTFRCKDSEVGGCAHLEIVVASLRHCWMMGVRSCKMKLLMWRCRGGLRSRTTSIERE